MRNYLWSFLLCLVVSIAAVRECKVKYTTKWPHCTNLRVGSASCLKSNLATMAQKCAATSNCNGFSWTAGSPAKGGGCYKTKCVPDSVNGYGQTSHMYYECKEGPAAVDGKFGPFSQWGSCSRICGGGVKRKTRSCNKPAPSNGGKYCSGAKTESTTCNTGHCAFVTNCGDIKTVFAKTLASIQGKQKIERKNLPAYEQDLTYILDEIKDGDFLLAKIKTLTPGNARNRMHKLVTDMRVKANTDRDALRQKITTCKGRLVDYDNKLKKMAHTEQKCECDAKNREIQPLMDRAEQKIKDNDTFINIAKKAIAKLRAGLVPMRAQLGSCSMFPAPLNTMMSGMYNQLITIQEKKIEEFLKMITKREGATKLWLGNLVEYKKQLKACADRVAALALKLKKMLEEFDMIEMWESTVFGEMQYDQDTTMEGEEMTAIVARVTTNVAATHVITATTTTTTTSASSVQSALGLLMSAGGLSFFVFGYRNTKPEYEQILEA